MFTFNFIFINCIYLTDCMTALPIIFLFFLISLSRRTSGSLYWRERGRSFLLTLFSHVLWIPCGRRLFCSNQWGLAGAPLSLFQLLLYLCLFPLVPRTLLVPYLLQASVRGTLRLSKYLCCLDVPWWLVKECVSIWNWCTYGIFSWRALLLDYLVGELL